MNIVIAYDGSDFAKVAIDDLLRAGLPQKANALVVCVVETLLPTPSAPMMDLPPRALPSRVAGTLLQARAETDQAREEASAFARQGSRRVQGLFPHWGVYPEPVVGAPAEAVIQKAIDWQADLIVIGSHGRSALARIVLGSVSKRVATGAPCSVRVARHVVERSGPGRLVGVDGSPGAEAAIGAVASRSWPAGTEARRWSKANLTCARFAFGYTKHWGVVARPGGPRTQLPFSLEPIVACAAGPATAELHPVPHPDAVLLGES
jgi:nucleotide-binding universal stress UspA family protein